MEHEMITALPPEFDVNIYLARNTDLAGMTPEQAADHHHLWGRDEGRICNATDTRARFLALVPRDAPLLEIGPYTTPAFRRPAHDVRYLDAFGTEELRARAVAGNMDPSGVPVIDHVWHGEPYATLVRTPMAAVFSSHNIEHQPDLIRHLRELGDILEPQGRLFFAIPDRRYCFDHFLRETTFADVFGAYHEKRRAHNAASVLTSRMLITHNDMIRHWRGDHGLSPFLTPITPERAAMARETMAEIEGTRDYIDAHAWQFTPASFRALIDFLALSGMIPFQVERVYPTMRYTNEFHAVLVRRGG